MAVSFKVPKSPSRQIFNTENFMGVDLTNSGTIMDEVRSPNAENMVRFVPGKVRKRTGYKTRVLFSPTDDVNRVEHTSSEWKQLFEVNDNDVIYEFYDSYIPLVEGDCYYAAYMDVRAKGNYTVYLDFMTGDSLSEDIEGEVDDNVCFLTLTPDTSREKPYRVRIVQNTRVEGDYFYIKGLRVSSTTNAATETAYKKLAWTIAPEDNDGKWIKTDNIKPVYGCHQLVYGSTKEDIYHVGKEFYKWNKTSDVITKIYTTASEKLSQAWQINNKLYIIDGSDLYQYTAGTTTIESASTNAYIPLVTIGKSPSGGGTSYEPLNMLQPGFYEQFTVDHASESAVNFQLSFNNLDNTEVKAWVLNSQGTWVLKVENTDFTVTRATGLVTFNTAPGESPVSGEDNVKILAYRTVEGYADRVKKCTIGTLYGINGAMDRLFLSGNPDYPNWDFFSQQNDPTYFPDLGYSVIGNASSAIVGYAIVNNYLATFKNKQDNSPAVFIRQGELMENEVTGLSEAVFRLINTLLGEGVVSPYAYGALPTEPLFLTKLGVYAVTPQDITGEKYQQKRSFYLDGELTKERNLEDAKAVIYKDQYILALNEKLYILDGLQATRTDRSEPYATRQYAGFFCTNIPAFTIWVEDNALWIGTDAGKICRFETDIDSLDSYNDDGYKIYCCWETCDLDGALFYKKEFFKYFAVRVKAALRTSVKLYLQKFGLWHFAKEDLRKGIYFDFEHVDFERFSFSTDTTDKVIATKVRARRVDKARFRVENDKLNEPLGLINLALEYTESGNYKEW